MINPQDKLIYLAEDDQLNGTLLRQTLENSGYRVSHAVNGIQLMELLTQKIPDLILLDLVMPLKSGYEVLEQMKQSPVLSKIKTIVITNLSLPEEADKALKLGASDCLVKANTSLKDILDKVSSYLDK